MRYLKIGLALLIGLPLLALGGLVAFDWFSQPREPDTGVFVTEAQQYHVRIKRDDFGVPHVFGKRDADVAFGLAFAHSEDDFATIQEVTLATRGTLAAVEGRKAAVTDYLVRLLGVWDIIDQKYDRDLPYSLKDVLNAYADGVNYYAALHPDKVARGLLPVTGRDIAAGFVFKTPFFYGLDRELRKINEPAPETKPQGSNGVAVSPLRAADGATRLLVNSHQPYSGPVAWYEAVLESQQGWHVAGGFFPGSPFMLHGHNATLGWANTVNAPDLVDVYRLKINPANPDQYLLDGKWRDFEKKDAAIRVNLLGPIYWTFHREVLRSAHGPVLRTDHGVFAIRYAGMGEIRQTLQYYRLDKAHNLAQWQAAMRLQALPSINYIYADQAGNIGYVYNGQFPVRKPGFNWKGILPGDRSDLIWHSYLPFDREPQIWNPKSGFVFNSNNTPFHATAPDDNLKPNDFPSWMGIQTNMTNRAWRAEETFGADAAIGAEDFRNYKFDLSYSPASELAEEIAEVLQVPPGNDADLKQAQQILRAWNRRTDIHNRGTALAVLMGLKVHPEEDGAPRKMAPLAALRQSIALLKQHFGRLDPEWGQLNRMRRGKYDLPIDGGPDIYRAVYGEEQKDGTFTAVGGDTLVMFVTWDRDGVVSSRSIHQFGSATLDRLSRHYDDQVPLFVAMKTKPVYFTEQQLEGHIEADYAPGERERAEQR